jgi:hypothetical protein
MVDLDTYSASTSFHAEKLCVNGAYVILLSEARLFGKKPWFVGSVSTEKTSIVGVVCYEFTQEP